MAPDIPDNFQITEGVSGTWFYHLSTADDHTKPLCDATKSTMLTELSLTSWGTVTHLRERYCERCLEIALGQE